MSIDLDSASYHVFEYKGSRLLYDVGTTTVCELNDFAHRFFELARQFPGELVWDELHREFPDVDPAEVDKVINQLKKNGSSRMCVF